MGYRNSDWSSEYKQSLIPDIAQANLIKKEIILVTQSQNVANQLFRNVLRDLSPAAFKFVVNSGIRDIDTFLNWKLMIWADIPPGTYTEFHRLQQICKQLRNYTYPKPGNYDSEVGYQSDDSSLEPMASDVEDHLFEETLSCLSTRSQNALTYGRVKNSSQFMRLHLDMMVGWPSTGAKVIAEILDVQKKFKATVCGFLSSDCQESELDKDILIADDSLIDHRSIEPSQHEMTSQDAPPIKNTNSKLEVIYEAEVSQECFNRALFHHEVRIAANKLLANGNSLTLIERGQFAEISFEQTANQAHPSAFYCFEDMAKSYVNSLTKTEHEKTIALGRLGLLRSREMTFSALGDLLSITDGRASQIWKKLASRSCHHSIATQLDSFWMAILEVVHSYGGACSLTEIASSLSRIFQWVDEPALVMLLCFLQLCDSINIDMQTGTVYDPSWTCLDCQSVKHALCHMFSESKDEKDMEDVAEKLVSNCRGSSKCQGQVPSLDFSKGFIYILANKVQGIIVEDGVVYCRDTWGSRRGSRTQLVESILKSAGRPMHFSIVFEQAKELLPEDAQVTKDNVYNWIGNSSNLLLWDRGTYIHRELVFIPEELIKNIECWLIQKLENNVPFVSVAGVYLAFKKDLTKASIPTESALYSCLRESNNDLLVYPRYPYVIFNRPGYERFPVNIALEQYILDAGGLITLQDIKAYAVNDLCIAEQMFSIHFSNTPNIARAGRGSYIHIENLKLGHGNLSALATYAAELASVAGHVSINKVFSDKQISCLSMGIDSPEMLYAILQMQADETIRLPGYPQVLANTSQNGGGGRSGVINEVADYIAQRKRACSFDELEQHFVDELGYNAGTVYNVIIRDNVVRYSRGSLIHLDIIEWTDERQHQLERLALQALAESHRLGRQYALTSYLLEYYTLPDLAGGVVWTQTLLSELLIRDERFITLGSARNAFITTPNDKGIETFEDLACELLKTRYEGACEIDLFEQDMQEAGIVQKRVTPGMLSDQKKVYINGHLIMLKELREHA